MVAQRSFFMGIAGIIVFVGVMSMAVYFALMIVGIWMYKAALREIEVVGGRNVGHFLSEHSWPSREKRVATLLFVIRARSSRLDACRRFGQFVFSAITPYVFAVIALLAVGLLAQGVGLVFGLYRMLDGMMEYVKCRMLCMGIGVAYFSFSAWGIVSCSRGLIRIRNLIKGKCFSQGQGT